MGIDFVQEQVRDVLIQGPHGAIEFFHGYTCHPPALAAGALDVYGRNGL